MTETTEPENNERPFYAVDLVAVKPNGDVLQIRRGWDPYEGMWALPGGHVDQGETSLDAAVRELLEETGVRVDKKKLDLVGVYDAPDRDPRGRYVSVAYMATVPDDTEAVAADDATDVRWAPLDAPGDDLAFDHALILRDAWRQRVATEYTRRVEEETSSGRCPAAHPSDPSDCTGPVAVTVVDASGAGLDGCEHHAARMLASLTGSRVYARPDAPEGAAIRTFKAAGTLRPYDWRQPLTR